MHCKCHPVRKTEREKKKKKSPLPYVLTSISKREETNSKGSLMTRVHLYKHKPCANTFTQNMYSIPPNHCTAFIHRVAPCDLRHAIRPGYIIRQWDRHPDTMTRLGARLYPGGTHGRYQTAVLHLIPYHNT